MTKFKFFISVVVIAGAAIFWNVQHQAQVQLHEENDSLRRQLDQLEMDNERLSNLVAQANSALPNEQFIELLKLRGEVGLLRQQTKELQTLREQNQQLQTALTSSNNLQATNLPSATPPLAIYPKSSWAFAGFATPEAAFQSLNWAEANGDLNTVLNNSTPDMQKQIAKEFENKSESDIVDKINEQKNRINENTEVSILSEDVQSDNQVVLTILGDAEVSGGNNASDSTHHLVFQKIGGQWKLAADH
jgi:hypothetical protein